MLGRDGLSRALDEYDPVMGLVNRDLVLKHHQDRKHAEALVALFRRVTAIGDDRPTAAAELARLSRLRWKAELEAGALRSQVDELTGRLQQAEEALHLSEQRRRRRARAARRAEDRLAELGEHVRWDCRCNAVTAHPTCGWPTTWSCPTTPTSASTSCSMPASGSVRAALEDGAVLGKLTRPGAGSASPLAPAAPTVLGDGTVVGTRADHLYSDHRQGRVPGDH